MHAHGDKRVAAHKTRPKKKQIGKPSDGSVASACDRLQEAAPFQEFHRTRRAEHRIKDSRQGVKTQQGDGASRAYRRAVPAIQEPAASPAMNTESTMETRAVVAPICALERRSQTSSYRNMQKPEIKKNPK